jgi:hypothetical protein
MATTPEMFSVLRNLASDITRSKEAAASPPARPTIKQADGPTPKDPGGYQGASSHPSAKIDNNVQDSSTGARASEHTSDMKADQGAPGVDSAPEAKHQEGSGSQDEQQLNIGTQQSATGEDASVEDDYKGDKDDPGTTHPMKASVGEKYGSVKFAEAKRRATTLQDEILADLANGYGMQLITKQAAAKPAAASASAAAAPASAASPASASNPSLLEKAAAAVKSQQAPALAAGYELAASLGVKQAEAQANVQACLEATIQDAELDATLFANYYRPLLKKAGYKFAGEDPEADTGEDHGAAADLGSGAGGGGESAAPPADGGGGGEESLGDLLGGGGDPGGMMDAGGGAPPGGGMGGEGDKTMALQQLVAALMELGVSPEELAAASAPPAPAGGAPGGSALGGGAPPPDPMAAMGGGGMGGGGGAPPMSEGMKLASAAKAFQRSGKFAFHPAPQGSAERELRDEIKGYVLEQLGNSRRAA